MYLESDGFKFPVTIIDEAYDDEVAVYVGQQNKPPCIILTFERGKKTAVLQGLSYFSHCSVSSNTRFTQRSGAVVLMLKVALQWLVDEYKISKVTFSDKSHSSQGFMLPEKMVLTEGQTWYQKYFDVQPDNDVTKATLKAYGRLYNEHKDYFKSLANNSWAMPKIRDKLKPFDKELKKQQLSGSVWHMTKQTIKGYNVPYSIHKEVLGGSKKMRGALHFTPSIWW